MVAQEQVRVNLKMMLLALLVMIAGTAYVVGMLPNGDPLWFLPVFQEKPIRVVLNDRGCRVEFFEGEKGFDEIYLSVNQGIAQNAGYSEQFGFGPGRLEEYRAKERSVELFYPHPVTVHANFRFGRPDSLFVPLTGIFADPPSVFGGHNGDYWSGAIRLKSLDAIRSAANAVQCKR